MIMGSGKTTVIGPMVALLLADGRSLVTQVVPDQLLDMSQNVMRNAFGSCVIKEVFSLTFTRNGPTDNWKGIAGLLRKLKPRQRRHHLLDSQRRQEPDAQVLDILAIEDCLPLLLVPRKFIALWRHSSQCNVMAPPHGKISWPI